MPLYSIHSPFARACRLRDLSWPLALLFAHSLGMAQEPRTQNPPPEGSQTPRQVENKPGEEPIQPERWNLFYQATSIGQYHRRFKSPYQGANSLQSYPERDVSLTTTLFLGLRLEQNTQ